ncbi:hypothetical protein M8453_23325 [Citrobacter freundii]|uniref:hypothetical protein n=1 Tax=Citrobacter freundii TaxID=546 RepID=UPI00214D8749|nr:hypothetical protein [Citrobacter freundii]MCR3717470.1 hypothetical protein [Citrobacter freundii]
MSNGKVIQIRQARPDAEEMKYFWKLYSAAQRVEDRWYTNTVPGIADALADTELSREEKLFLLRAWQVLVDDRGGFGRHLGALDTYIHNIQDPDDGCVEYKPELKACLEDGLLFDVICEAYTEAKTRIAELEAREMKLPRMAAIYWHLSDASKRRTSEENILDVLEAIDSFRAAGIGVKG